MEWRPLRPSANEFNLGYIPAMLDPNDHRSARDQINANYSHGGGWSTFEGFTLGRANTLQYPGDPPLFPLWEARLRNEVIRVYQYAWVTITQPDGSWIVAHID